MKKDQELSMDNFFKLAHFSDVPIVNEYYKSIKAIHHNGDITKGIEEFANWQSQHSYSERELKLKIQELIDDYDLEDTGVADIFWKILKRNTNQ